MFISPGKDSIASIYTLPMAFSRFNGSMWQGMDATLLVSILWFWVPCRLCKSLSFSIQEMFCKLWTSWNREVDYAGSLPRGSYRLLELYIKQIPKDACFLHVQKLSFKWDLKEKYPRDSRWPCGRVEFRKTEQRVKPLESKKGKNVWTPATELAGERHNIRKMKGNHFSQWHSLLRSYVS